MTAHDNIPDDTDGMEQPTPRDPRCDASDSAPGSGAGDGASGASGAGDGTGGGAGALGSADGDTAGDVTPDETALFGETVGEEALRALMHGAVRDLHGSPDALDRLRRGVPLRRQRRRQAAFGAVAAVLLVGLAVPAVIHAAGNAGSPSAAPVGLAGSHGSAHGGQGATRTGDGSSPTGSALTPPDGTFTEPSGGSATDLPSTPAGTGPTVPDCSSDQLGQGASQAGTPGSGGRVNGWFRVANVSDSPCTVPSGGVVQAVAQGAADQAKIQVIDHAAGDPSLGLPAAAGSGPVVLGPGQDYEIAFAFVPSASGSGGCPAPTTPPSTPTPSDSPTDSGGSDSGSGDPGSQANVNGQQQAPPPTAPPAGIALNHTPAAGAPVVVGPVIQGACAGTVYTTTPMPAPSTGTTAP